MLPARAKFMVARVSVSWECSKEALRRPLICSSCRKCCGRGNQDEQSSRLPREHLKFAKDELTSYSLKPYPFGYRTFYFKTFFPACLLLSLFFQTAQICTAGRVGINTSSLQNNRVTLRGVRKPSLKAKGSTLAAAGEQRDKSLRPLQKRSGDGPWSCS